MPDFQDFLKNSSKPILFGGAMGTELQRRGVVTKLPLWSATANFSDQDLLREIHEDYLKAGVNMVITNTFRTTEWLLRENPEDRPFTAFDLTKNAVRILNEAVERVSPSQPVFIGGCVAPLADCYKPEDAPARDILEKEHTINVEQLLQGGHLDFIAAETHNSIIEAEIICKIAKERGMPFTVSFATKGAKLLNGESFEEAISRFEDLGASAILLNCSDPKEITEGLKIFQGRCKVPYGGYGNGIGHAHDDLGWKFNSEGSPDDLYEKEVKKWLDLGSKIIGGCCGTTPQTIARLKSTYIDILDKE